MSYTELNQTIDSNTAGTTQFNIPFTFLSTADVQATKNGNNLNFTVSGTGANQTLTLDNSESALVAGDVIRIFRDSINSTVTFVPGASINAGDLNDSINRALYVGEENRVSLKLKGDLDLNGKFLDGVLKVKRSHSVSQPELRLYCQHDQIHYASIKAPSAADFEGSDNITFKIPSNYGTDGQVLKSDGSGETSWVTRLESLVEDTTPQLGGDLDLNSKFLSGNLKVKATGDRQGQIRLYCHEDSSHYAAIKAPPHDDFTGDLTFKIPSSYGTSGQVLTSDGSGGTSWVTRLESVVEDTTPQLGGDLDLDGNFLRGVLKVKSNNNTQGQIRLYCSDSDNHYVTLKAPFHSNFTGDLTFRIPSSYGSNGQVLTSDGSGGTSWSDGGITRAQSTAMNLIFS